MEHTFIVENTEFTVKLAFSDYEGALNQVYAFVFHVHEKGNKELKAIRIAVIDRVIDMWNDVGGNKDIIEDKEVFAWQLVPYYLPLLASQEKIQVVIYFSEIKEKQNGVIYIKAAKTISDTARDIIFSGNIPSNNLIRREILKICYNEWLNNPHGFVNRSELLKFIPVSEVELERNLDYLQKTYFIEGGLTSGGYMNVKITPQGIDTFEDPTEFEKRFALRIEQTTNNIGGDMIVTQLTGNDNQSIVKSKVEKTAEKEKNV